MSASSGARSSSPTHLLFGQTYQIGRARACRVNLPDRPHNENIVWRPEVGEGATIRARNGEIPKSQFYTDSIMVASQHAEIGLSSEPVLHSIARHCYTFIRRGDDVFALYPTRGRGGPTNLDLLPGDQILIGNSVFEVDYPPADAPRRSTAASSPPPPPPLPRDPLSASSLAAAIDEDGDTPPADDADLPAAAGFGESGPPPDPVQFETGPDSIIDVGPPPVPDFPEINLPHIDAPPPAPPPLAPPMLLDSIDESLTNDLVEIDEDDAGATPPSLPPDPGLITGPPPLPDDPTAAPDPTRAPPPPVLGTPDSPTMTIPPVSPADLPGPPPVPLQEPEDIFSPDGPPPPPVSLGALDGDPEDSIFDALSASPEEISPDEDPVRALGADETEEVPMADAPADAVPPPVPPPPVPAAEDTPPPVPPAPPAPEDAPTLPTLPSAADGREVVVVDEADWQQELSRPARLVLVGWMASGDVLVGNHRGADVIIPENRAEPEQTFAAADYFSVFVRGRRARATHLGAADARLEVDGAEVEETKDAAALLEVIRRDPDGEPDFEVPLRLRAERMLPDPRARLLAVDSDDPMVAALFALGLPLRTARTLTLGQLTMTATFDGEVLVVTDYLDSYRDPEGGGFRSFFIKHGDAAFRTAPEDGSPVRLAAGDHLLVGAAIYRFGAD